MMMRADLLFSLAAHTEAEMSTVKGRKKKKKRQKNMTNRDVHAEVA